MSGESRFRWGSASCSHVGLVRDINEDACLEQSARGLWAVADGMGGHTLGDFASRLVVETLERAPASEQLETFVATVKQGLQAANRQLCQEAIQRDVQVIGSTVVVLLARERQVAYLWAGDSRIYLYRKGRLISLSRDHSQVEELKSQGSITPEEALHHPARHLITRAVGAQDELEVDAGTLEARDEDMFLLCSDGLSNEVGDEEIGSALASGNCRQAAEVLVDSALRHGGRDNISAVVVRAEDLHNADATVLNPALL